MAYNFDKFEEYCENLLNAQYGVSEVIEHKLTRGEIREDFLCDVIRDGFVDPPNLQRGIVAINGSRVHRQIDLMLCREAARRAPIRSSRFSMIEAQDIKLIIEVKSNATFTDIKNFNQLARQVKNIGLPHPPQCGMFCYNLRPKMDTVFRRFGFSFDQDSVQFADDTDRPTIYPHLDFLISIDTKEHLPTGLTSQYTIIKNNDTGRYYRSTQFPTIKNLFTIIQQALQQH